MKLIRFFAARALGACAIRAIAMLLFAIASLPARATEQASYVIPLTGPHSMADLAANYFNPALRALASCHNGTSAPANGPGAAALPYQCWIDTTSNPAVYKIYDGASWVTIGKLNTSSHGWTPSYLGTDLGTASTATTGTSGHVLGFIDTALTWSASQTLTLNQNASTTWDINNNSTGTAAFAAFRANNSNGGAGFGVGGSAFNSFSSNLLNRGYVYSAPALDGIALYADGAKAIRLYTNNVLGLTLDSSQNVILANALSVLYGGSGATTAAGARTNFGVTATGADTAYAFRANNLSDLANAGTARTNLGVAIGSNVEAWDADLDCLAALSGTGILRRTGAGTCSNGTAVTNAELNTMNAYTWKCNNTAGSAVPTDCDTTAFTLKASPAAGDIVLIQDSAASNAYKRTTVSALSAAGSVGSFNGQTGAVVSYFEPQGRLTLATGTPVMASTQSAKTTIFYTPYHGNMVPIYDGTNMVPTAVAEISVATTDTTKSPAAIGASKVNDWFIWNDSGTIRVGHGPDWTNDTTRSAGTALTIVNGILLNNASITNGPAASRGTYVGTTRSNGSSQLDFIFGASNTAGFFGVWNTYNRVTLPTSVSVTSDSHTYTSATPRQASGAATWQISFVVGQVEDGVTANLVGQINPTSATSALGYIGAALNSTSSFTHGRNFVQAVNGVGQQLSTTHSAAMMPAAGLNVISANEASDGVNSCGFNASSANLLSASIRL